MYRLTLPVGPVLFLAGSDMFCFCLQILSYPSDQVQDGVLSPAGGKDKGKADKKDKKDDKKKDDPKVSRCLNGYFVLIFHCCVVMVANDLTLPLKCYTLCCHNTLSNNAHRLFTKHLAMITRLIFILLIISIMFRRYLLYCLK